MGKAIISVKLKTIQVHKMPDITGFLRAMRDLGAKVEVKGNTIVVDLRKEVGNEATKG